MVGLCWLMDGELGECGGGVYTYTWWMSVGDILKWYFFTVDSSRYH